MKDFKKHSFLVLLVFIFSFLCLYTSAQDRFAAENNIEAAEGFKIIKNLFYAENQNQAQALDLFIPESRQSEKLPIIVYIHGGGWQNGNKEMGLEVLRPFLKNGKYIGCSINYRLSGEAKWPAQIYDCKAALRWIKANANKYGIDKDKIGIWGTSAGGHLVAMLALTSESNEFNGEIGKHLNETAAISCAVDGFGPSDLLAMDDRPGAFEHNSANSPESKLIGGALQQNKDKALNASPVSWVSNKCEPMLIYHGTDDKLVIIEQSDKLYSLLKEAGTDDIYYIKINGAGHGARHQILTERMGLFFERYLYNNESMIIDESELNR
jgi:acetyl esterase/lipase